MIETAHVNERKHASTNQHPVGDDVSALQPLRSSAGFLPLATQASPTGHGLLGHGSSEPASVP
jgi:hypothetical protein